MAEIKNEVIVVDCDLSARREGDSEEQRNEDDTQEKQSDEDCSESNEKNDAVRREVTSSGDCLRFESSSHKDDANISSTDGSHDIKNRVTLRPSVLRVGKSDSSSVSLDTESKIENKVFRFTPLSTTRVISSTTDTFTAEINANCSKKAVNGNKEEPSNSHSISSSLFTSLSQNQASTVSSSTSPAAGEQGFVFGQNLEDRVLLPDSSEESNGIDKQSNDLETSEKPSNSEKRKFEAITGEEGESNVLQIYCKLYSWESSGSSWKERGKGLLRLNDKIKDDKLCSRLVMRTSGSLKVILNSIIVAGMKFELSNEQCLRFTNLDGIYLIKGKDKDIEKLHSAVDCRLRELSKKIKSEEEEEEYALSKEKPHSTRSEEAGHEKEIATEN
ncbi:ran-binding protein 3-like isoform X1 [Leptotrombidium deliense]|uniref:Ran-binding protein 3-like isoform X1 n=1 Tax=Leptotrombidium deliense TaxID=299467 RepID=A0A443SS05_9ACAR|nr:ran-binding protein 3-like isoform X1 [Leptotrombidium deliense]